MPRRYYICPVIGDGQSIATHYRPALLDVVDPQTGRPAFHITMVDLKMARDVKGHGVPALPWALCIADGDDHSLADGVKGVQALPQAPLNAVLTKDSALINAVADKIDLEGVATQRDLINKLGAMHQRGFDADKFA